MYILIVLESIICTLWYKYCITSMIQRYSIFYYKHVSIVYSYTHTSNTTLCKHVLQSLKLSSNGSTLRHCVRALGNLLKTGGARAPSAPMVAPPMLALYHYLHLGYFSDSKASYEYRLDSLLMGFWTYKHDLGLVYYTLS